MVGVTFRKPRHDILDVVTEVKAVQFAALKEGVHECHVACAIVAPAMEPVTPAHGYVAEHTLRGVVVYGIAAALAVKEKAVFEVVEVA